MATSTPPPSPSLSSDGASWRLRRAQRLSWLISALSGTLESEADHKQRMRDYEQRQKEDEQEIAKLDVIILRTRSEKKQMEKETERLAALESKIEALFSKHGIHLPLV